MTEKKRKLLYWIFKGASVFIACTLPILAICEKFPLWAEQSGTGRTVGAGIIMIGIVLLIIFRRSVFTFIKDHLNIKYAPPITIWLVLILISYGMIYISNALRDMNTVFWMGFIGCAIGTALTYISEQFKSSEDE